MDLLEDNHLILMEADGEFQQILGRRAGNRARSERLSAAIVDIGMKTHKGTDG